MPQNLFPRIRIAILVGNVLSMSADVLVLKYAQNLYGVDLAASRRFWDTGIDFTLDLPGPGSSLLIESSGVVGAATVLFVGTPPLVLFGYEEIRKFGRQALASLAREVPDAREILLTVHGPGFGLDEIEAFESEIAGLIDAVAKSEVPRSLAKITIVEINTNRAQRLQASLEKLLPGGEIRPSEASRLFTSAAETLRNVGHDSANKPSVFVAMPFAEELDDLFHYGIQSAVNAAGFLCERADLMSFAGDVVAWVKERIASSSLVIADLSTANPNVYLEVGYAWGCGKRTVLVVRDASELKFDVRGQRCLIYGKSIKQLEELLRRELESLR